MHILEQHDNQRQQPDVQPAGATVECNPRFGPSAFATAAAYGEGKHIEPRVTNKDNFYDISNAQASLAGSY